MREAVARQGLGLDAIDGIDAHPREGAEICAGISHEVFGFEIVIRSPEKLNA